MVWPGEGMLCPPGRRYPPARGRDALPRVRGARPLRQGRDAVEGSSLSVPWPRGGGELFWGRESFPDSETPTLYPRGRAVESPPRPRLPSPKPRLDASGWGTGGGGKENYGKQLISETSACATSSIPKVGTAQEGPAAPSRGAPWGRGRGQPAAAGPSCGHCEAGGRRYLLTSRDFSYLKTC